MFIKKYVMFARTTAMRRVQDINQCLDVKNISRTNGRRAAHILNLAHGRRAAKILYI